MRLPLEGIRIVEMGQLIAIPHATKLLADAGAQVIRIESCGRLELYRTQSLYNNDVEGSYWNRGANFYDQNRNKLGITLDLRNSQGLDILKDLISISDIFAQNFTPRVIGNFGLGYESLLQIKPDLIMVSSTGYGHSGPWANYGAIAYGTEAASGLTHMTGYKNGPPALPQLPHADYTAAEHTLFGIMAALMYRARTGKGQFIDVSQAQANSSTIPEALMDYTVNGRIVERMGNQDLTMSPHGCYPCLGKDKWIAIAISSDNQWASLREVFGSPDWSGDSRFSDPFSRWTHRDKLDQLVARSTRQWDAEELMHVLQKCEVPAGVVLNNKGLLSDPHLKSRRFYETNTHHHSTGMPPLPYPGRPWKMSETPGDTRAPAPILGEHNQLVLGEILGRPEAELETLENEGVIGHTPIGHHPPTVTSLADQKRRGQIADFDLRFRQWLRDEYSL